MYVLDIKQELYVKIEDNIMDIKTLEKMSKIFRQYNEEGEVEESDCPMLRYRGKLLYLKAIMRRKNELYLIVRVGEKSTVIGLNIENKNIKEEQ